MNRDEAFICYKQDSIILRKYNIEVKSVYKYKMAERMLKSYVEYLYEIGKIDTIIDSCFIKYIRPESKA